MGFFDSLSMLTIGRGGRFEEIPGNRLRYVPSGDEPIVHAGSRRGLPFLAKSVYDGLPPRPMLRRLRAAEQRGLSTPLRFRDEVWPHVVRDANEAFYVTLHRRIPLDLDTIAAAIDAEDVRTLPGRLRALLPGRVEPLDLPAMLGYRVPACDAEEYQRRVVESVEEDLTEADAGLASPLKAALWEVNAARRFSIEKAAFDGVGDEGHNGDLAEFLTFGGMIGSGPPAFRSRRSSPSWTQVSCGSSGPTCASASTTTPSRRNPPSSAAQGCAPACCWTPGCGCTTQGAPATPCCSNCSATAWRNPSPDAMRTVGEHRDRD